MVVNRGKQDREVEQTPKSRPSSDCRLQPACMKLESLVIADQHAAMNTFRALYTPPVTPWESEIPEASAPTFMEGAVEGGAGNWGEVVTR